MRYYLRRISDKLCDHKILDLDTEEVTIGRAVDVRHMILSADISRRHAILQKRDKNWFIMDTNSMNGVHVNNRKLTPSKWYHLSQGDCIALTPPASKEAFVYELQVNAAPTTEESEDDGTPPLDPQQLQDRLQQMECLLREKDKTQKELEQKLKEAEARRTKEMNAKLAEDRRRLEEKYQCDLEMELNKKEEELEDSLQQQTRRITEDMESVQARLRNEFNQQLSEHDRELRDKLQRERTKLEKDLKHANSKMVLLKAQIKKAKTNDDKSKESSARAVRESVVKTFTEVMDMELQCSICNELFIKAVTLNCAHSYCAYCIAVWQKTNGICPICRAPISTKTNSYVLDSFIEKMSDNISDEMKGKRKTLVAERTAAMEAEKTMKPPKKKQRTAGNPNTPSTSRASRGRRVANQRATVSNVPSTSAPRARAPTTATATVASATDRNQIYPVVHLNNLVDMFPAPRVPRLDWSPMYMQQMARDIANRFTAFSTVGGPRPGPRTESPLRPPRISHPSPQIPPPRPRR